MPPAINKLALAATGILLTVLGAVPESISGNRVALITRLGASKFRKSTGAQRFAFVDVSSDDGRKMSAC